MKHPSMPQTPQHPFLPEQKTNLKTPATPSRKRTKSRRSSKARTTVTRQVGGVTPAAELASATDWLDLGPNSPSVLFDSVGTTRAHGHAPVAATSHQSPRASPTVPDRQHRPVDLGRQLRYHTGPRRAWQNGCTRAGRCYGAPQKSETSPPLVSPGPVTSLESSGRRFPTIKTEPSGEKS